MVFHNIEVEMNVSKLFVLVIIVAVLGSMIDAGSIYHGKRNNDPRIRTAEVERRRFSEMYNKRRSGEPEVRGAELEPRRLYGMHNKKRNDDPRI